MNNNAIITGKFNPRSETLDFYAECNGEHYYIFTRKYRISLFNYFRNGVSIYKLFDFSRAHGNEVIINTLVQLKSALKYIEKEHDIQLLHGKRPGKHTCRHCEDDIFAA